MARRQINNKRIVITGASSGIGHCLAAQLAAAGARLVVTARRHDRLESLRLEIENKGGICHVIAGDITSDETQHQILESCQNNLGGLDCLINNAGIGAMGPFATASVERMRKVFEVNFFAMASMVHAAIPMLQNGDDPLIVNVGSVLGHRAVPLKSEYCASKFAVHGFSDSIRAELESIPIDVLLISPSTVRSEFFDSAIEDTTNVDWNKGSPLKPDYVAEKIVRAIQRRKHEIILPLSGTALVWFDRLFPTLANRIISRFAQ